MDCSGRLDVVVDYLVWVRQLHKLARKRTLQVRAPASRASLGGPTASQPRSDSHRRVDPSVSVNRNVTTPDGTPCQWKTVGDSAAIDGASVAEGPAVVGGWTPKIFATTKLAA